MPMPTAVSRSTNTVSSSTTTSTKASARGILNKSLRPLKSIMPQPTEMSMPANTDRGTYFTNPPSPSSTASRKSECITPESRERPPLFTFTTVRMVAPAPEIPQNSPDTILPMPWPISSRLLLWCVLVILSATTEVSSVSMEPSPARVRPGMMEILTIVSQSIPARLTLSLAKNGMGNPAGISPMVSFSG